MSTIDTATTEVVTVASTDEALNHPAFAVLNSCKAGLSLQDKRGVLKALLAHVRHSHFETETLQAHPIKTFIDDHRRIKTTNQTQRLVAEALMNYHFFLQVNKVNKRKKRRASSRPTTTASTASTEAASAIAKLSQTTSTAAGSDRDHCWYGNPYQVDSICGSVFDACIISCLLDLLGRAITTVDLVNWTVVR